MESTEDERILKELYRILEIEVRNDEIYVLNQDQLNAVEEARNQLSKGLYITNDAADNEIDEWLK